MIDDFIRSKSGEKTASSCALYGKSDVGMTAGSAGGQVATVVGLTVVGLCK